MTHDYRAIQHQVSDQMRAIEQASAPEQRLLVIELARMLARWEAGQTAPLPDREGLLRAAHWAILAETAAGEAERVAVTLSEKKARLREGLQDSARRIDAQRGQLDSLRQEVEALHAELAEHTSCAEALRTREAELRAQLAACEQLRACQAQAVATQAEWTRLCATWDAQHPALDLHRLAELQATLVSNYRAYLVATAAIADQMGQPDGGGLDPGPDLLEVPERLRDLDRELQAIDRILTAHLRQQDTLDAEIKARVR